MEFYDFISDKEIKLIQKDNAEKIIKIKNLNVETNKMLLYYEKTIDDLENKIRKIESIIEERKEYLDEEKKILKKFKNDFKKYSYSNINMMEEKINNFKKKIKEKTLEINQLNFNIIYLNSNENLISVIFTEKKNILYSFVCKNTDEFSKIESSFYDIYPHYKDIRKFYLVNDNKIDTSKTLEENNINNGDIIELKSN